MNNFSKALLPGARLILISLLYAAFLLIFRFQLTLYWFKSTRKLISGLEEISNVSWKVAGIGLFLSFLGIVVGCLVLRLKENRHGLQLIEHRIYYAALFFLLAWLGILSRTLLFNLSPLDQPTIIGTCIFALLVSLTVKFPMMGQVRY